MTPVSAERRTYHHGDLRRVLLAAAVEAIGESGPAALSLRDLARRAGVSHAAPAHHFRDKAGLLTALATEGFDLLDAELARAGDGDLLEVGVGYIRFAVAHRAHFEVMFRPELYHRDDPALLAARQRAGQRLRAGIELLPAASADGAAGSGSGAAAGAGFRADVGADADAEADRLAAWSIVHGFATLWLGGALPPTVGADPETAGRAIIRRLFDRDRTGGDRSR